MNSQQQLIEDKAEEWAKADVGTLSSFANMESLLKREYFGRFIIELIQNARDAWYALGKDSENKSVVRIILHSDGVQPVLTVCNQGLCFNAERLLKHITQFGESSKASGEGIGHKGIGFKSVLEITRTPQIYSREDTDGDFTLKVGFDPRKSECLLDQHNDKPWEQLVKEYDKKGLKNKDQRLPVLRFPHWIETPSDSILEEANWNGIAFNTLIRLPYDSAFDSILNIDRERWQQSIEAALDAVTDEIVMLIDAFDQVVIENRLKGEVTYIKATPIDTKDIGNNVISQQIFITRNNQESSNWLLYKKNIQEAETTKISQEIVIGVRYKNCEGKLVPLIPETQSRCFHLFFPTRIDSKLPFLFHAYFEVDAGRTRFAPDSIDTNNRLLEKLRELFICVVKDLIKRDEKNEFIISELPALFQSTEGIPDDSQAKEFRSLLLDDLDSLPWVAIKHVAGRRTCKPNELLLHRDPEIFQDMTEIFTPHYTWEKTHCLIPDSSVKNGIDFIASRLGDDALSLETLKLLLLPGQTPIWTENENISFLKLLELTNKLQARLGTPFIALIEELRGTDDSQIIPTLSNEGYKFVSLPSKHIKGQRKSDLAVFARLKEKSEITLEPPECLKIAFVQDGVLKAEMLSGPAQLLGIRDYTVQSILDWLRAEDTYEEAENGKILNFIWQLLLKEDVSSYGVKSVVEKLSSFSPGSWWWYQKERGRSDTEMADQRRSEALNSIKLPAQSGQWIAAEKLAFGKKWASCLAGLKINDGDSAFSTRIASFNDLEELAADKDSIVADPDTLSELLQLPSLEWQDKDSITLPDDEAEKKALLMFCFLQRLGVWEIMPVKAVVDYKVREYKDPWETNILRKNHRELVSLEKCEFNRYQHKNVYVAEDFDWAWPIQGNPAFVNSLSIGCPFYSKLTQMILFCPGCQTHTTRYDNKTATFQPSMLMWRLVNEKWLSCDIGDGKEEVYSPTEVWWESNIPEASRMRTSPLRFLPIARNMAADTAELCRLKSLDRIYAAEIKKLLTRLRDDYDSGALFNHVSKDSSFRQAFLGLHQRLYSRLRQIGDRDSAYVCIAEVGLLCEIGGLLAWQSPEKCKYDNGKFAAYKHHFITDVHFSVLSRGDEDTAIATFLQIPDFEVRIKRSDDGKEEDVTTEFPYLNDRLAHLFALLVYYKIGASSLSIENKDFPLRLQRIKNLRILKVNDLHLTLVVEGTSYSKTIGEGSCGDLYLDKTDQRRPLIYHDYKELEWPELLRSRIAPFISELIVNHAYSDAITLLFQCPETDLPYFLNERGISDNEMAAIRSAIGQSDKILQRQTQVWWSAILKLLEIAHEPLPVKDVFLVVSSIIEKSNLPENFKYKLLKHSDVEHAREDSKGILLEIESEGFCLEKLNDILLQKFDQGISVRIAKQLMSDWLSKYEKELAYTLHKMGVPEDHAKNFARKWSLPTRLSFRIQVDLVEVMVDFASSLNELCNSPDKQFSADGLSHDPFLQFSTLSNESPQELSCNCKLFYSDEERQRIGKNNFAEVKRRLALYITAIKTGSAAPSFKIRETHQSVMDAFAICVNSNTLIVTLKTLCGEDSALLVDYFSKLLADEPLLGIPDKNDMQKSIGSVIDLDALNKVQAVLAQTNREKIDQMRKKIAELKEAAIDFKPYNGSSIKPAKTYTPGIKSIKPFHVSPKNNRLLKKMGSDAEQWVLAALLDQLEKLWNKSVDDFDSCLNKMANELERYYEGPSVKKLISFKEKALLADLNDDERMEALSNFIHLSKESDEFGCDMLGWIAPFESIGPKPLFLEVKSDVDRKFNVSENEWKQAQRIEDNYAFMVVLRGKTNTPECFELLPNPYQLANDDVRKLTIVPDGRIVSYTISAT